jgi:hypothetical protein
MLKQLLKYVLLLLLPFTASANFVNWLGNYDTAHQKALKEHKPLLVLVVKKDSPLSGSIIKNHFMGQSYVDTINKKMIAVIVTYESKLSYPIEMYYTKVFPALFFVDSERELFLQEPLCGKMISKKFLKLYVDTLGK